ncbi:efflux RND transporter periplasmic adaptor subunit [Candidatus Nucleicultrix amoebiphila]|uniref:efflux RND transporter periplasmic adaptor subunit n=1 Tax=Candidatus Nucleicultrix amoebiphila TaxID=1509244 RepID=UPI000A2691E5|nr:efflux RND transporter periplasmic adaptor subunit [Candidatus Nucleicultrix amoebiphila]
MNNSLFKSLTAFSIIVLSFSSIAKTSNSSSPSMEMTTSKAKKQKTPLYWIDAMEPTIRYDKPGKSRMGMELVPVYGEESKSPPVSPGEIHIDPQITNTLGVRTAAVKESTLFQKIRAYGSIAVKEDNITSVTSHADGWIKKLYANELGEIVQKDKPLFDFYSPRIVQIQQEYIIFLKQDKKSENVRFLKNTLKTLGLSDRQIENITTTKSRQDTIPFYSPVTGVISELNVREGAQVKGEDTLLKITDLSTVWAILEVFGEEAFSLKAGQTVDIHIPDVSEKVWSASIEYVYPEANPSIRTVKVRVLLPNPEGFLRPNMVVNARILTSPKKALTIPREALIYGTSKNYVIVSLGEGRFSPRFVTPGIETEEDVEILAGLKVGEKVVTSGQFLIDSESNLKASLQRLETQKGDNHDHKHQ